MLKAKEMNRASSGGASRRPKPPPARDDAGPAGVTLIELRKAVGETKLNRIFSAELNDRGLAVVPEVLSELPMLKCLNLAFNGIRDLAPLKVNKQLRELGLNSNLVETTADLTPLRELRSLSLQHNKLVTLGDALAGMRKLEVLRVDGNGLGAGGLGKVPSSVKVLDISENQLEAIQGLEILTALEELAVSDNKLEKISGLAKCKALFSLDASDNYLTTCVGIKALVNLRVLNLGGNALSSLGSLPVMAKLEELDLSGNRLTSIDGLAAKCPEIEVLDVARNPGITPDALFGEIVKMEALVELSLDESLIAQNRDRWTTLVMELQDLELVNGKLLRPPAPSTSRPTSAAGRPGTAGGGGRPAMRPMSAVAQAKVSLASHLDRQMDELMGGTKGAEDELAAQFEALQATLGGLAAAKTEPGDRGLSAGASAGAGRRGRSDLLQRAATGAGELRPSTASTAALPPPPESAVACYGPKNLTPAAAAAATDLASLLLGFADQASAPARPAPAHHPLDGPAGVRPSSSASARSRIGSARAFAATAAASGGDA